jgi:hypothetical protein
MGLGITPRFESVRLVLVSDLFILAFVLGLFIASTLPHFAGPSGRFSLRNQACFKEAFPVVLVALVALFSLLDRRLNAECAEREVAITEGARPENWVREPSPLPSEVALPNDRTPTPAHPSNGLIAQLNEDWRVVDDSLQWILARIPRMNH